MFKYSLNIMFHGAMKGGPGATYTITVLCYKGEILSLKKSSFVMSMFGINFRRSPSVFSDLDVYVLPLYNHQNYEYLLCSHTPSCMIN